MITFHNLQRVFSEKVIFLWILDENQWILINKNNQNIIVIQNIATWSMGTNKNMSGPSRLAMDSVLNTWVSVPVIHSILKLWKVTSEAWGEVCSFNGSLICRLCICPDAGCSYFFPYSKRPISRDLSSTLSKIYWLFQKNSCFLLEFKGHLSLIRRTFLSLIGRSLLYHEFSLTSLCLLYSPVQPTLSN